MTDHPIIPPRELVQQWAHSPSDWNTVVSLIAQWGADQELEACCERLRDELDPLDVAHFRAARRPKPQSLKKLALKEMDKLDAMWDVTSIEDESLDILRRALEALPDD